ncbi:hypothetical protein GF352_00170 [archaeon]|nr:hypothetical protein [archaeon]
MKKHLLILTILLLTGCTQLTPTENNIVNQSLSNESTTELAECGEWIDLYQKTINISQYGNGELILNFFNLFKKSPTNITSIELDNKTYTGGLIPGHQDTQIIIPITNHTSNYLKTEIRVNYTNKNNSYSSICEITINEEDYTFFKKTLILPGSNEYELSNEFTNPLNISQNNQGPNNCTSLEQCIKYCNNTKSTECKDWIHSIHLSLNTSNQANITGKHNGAWLPTIDTIRHAVKLIPSLKQDGVNTVSFGPDIVTRDQDYPITAGDNIFKFYVKVFEDSGFNVNLVPNSMHHGNNEGMIEEFNKVVLDWALIAEELDTKFYTTLNEVEGHDSNLTETSDWLKEMLPLVKEQYSGQVCVQPTARTYYTGDPDRFKLNYSGYDCITTFYSLLDYAYGEDRFYSEKELLINEINNTLSKYDSIKRVMPTDVAAFHGGNWAEDSIMCDYVNGVDLYSNESEHCALFEFFFTEVYPYVNGSFLNNYLGFTWTGTSVEEVVKEYYTNEGGVLNDTWSDELWNTTGLLELIEDVMIPEDEELMIFDVYEYTAGWAGLDYEPTTNNPGPFNCTSIKDCMEYLRQYPEEYLNQSGGCNDSET